MSGRAFRRPSSRCAVVLTLSLAALAACTDPVGSGGQRVESAGVPRASAVNYTPDYELEMPVSNPHDTQFPSTLLGSYNPTYITWVEFEASGTVTGTYQHPHPREGEVLSYDAAGLNVPWSGCIVAVSVSSTWGAGGFVCESHVTTTRFHVRGDVYASRPRQNAAYYDGGVGATCGPYDCLSYGGSYHLTMRRVPAEMTLEQVPAGAISPNQTVEIVVERTPKLSQIGRVVTSAVMHRADGSGSRPLPFGPSAGSISAYFKPAPADTGAWTVTITGFINGEEQTKDLPVEVLNCISPDSILNHLSVRTGMRAALDQAISENHEFPFVIVRGQDGQYTVATVPDPSASECTAHTVDITHLRDQGWDVVATGHTHLHGANVQYYCSETGRIETSPEGDGIADWSAVDALTAEHGEYPHYIIDPDYVYPMYPDQHNDAWESRLPATPACHYSAPLVALLSLSPRINGVRR